MFNNQFTDHEYIHTDLHCDILSFNEISQVWRIQNRNNYLTNRKNNLKN